MRTALVLLLVALPCAAQNATQKALMDCNREAAGMSGNERKQFIADCFAKNRPPPSPSEIAAKKDAAARAKKPGASLGMTPEQVINETVWGKPQKVNRTTTASGVREQWVYGGRNYLYFQNGVLTAIQN